ncbi:MAG TPA: hypothetical protein VFY32_01115 [Solirubrobacteraceae bacterium]|nr:hypothetical protein [Solirubrobacteraceae bacterium]
MTQYRAPSDPELKARHRAMWASGDYPSMVETQPPPLWGREAHVAELFGADVDFTALKRNGRDTEFEAALDVLCDEWDHGRAGRARFELEYLLAVGTRA